MAVWIDLQAELTIVSTSQTKHLIPCFQYEFDIQQYSTTPGGQCWGSDPQCRGRWKDWYYHDVGHETSIAMVRKYKRVQVVLCQYMEPLGWATCQRLSPHPDILFYKISNDVHVHRLFLNLRCDERSTPNTSRVFCLASLISSHWHQQIFHFPGYISLRKVTQTQQPASFLPPGRYGLLSYTRIIYHVLTDQGGEPSCTWEGFLLFLNSYFLPLRTFFRCLEASESNLCLLKLKSTHPHWIHLFVCLVCLGVVLNVFDRQ